MAHFIGYLNGARGEASRLGTKASGVTARARGWDIGGAAQVEHVNGDDIVRLYVDGGSNSGRSAELVATFKRGSDGAFERVK